MDDWKWICHRIGEVRGRPLTVSETHARGGGCTSSGYCLEGYLDGEAVRYFVKRNPSGPADMFAAEAEGLRELAAANAVRVPQPLCWGAASGGAYLVLEFVELQPATRASSSQLGQGLVKMHRTCAERFGWRRDNFYWRRTPAQHILRRLGALFARTPTWLSARSGGR